MCVDMMGVGLGVGVGESVFPRPAHDPLSEASSGSTTQQPAWSLSHCKLL